MANQTIVPANVFTSRSSPSGQLTATVAITQGDVLARGPAGETRNPAVLARSAAAATALERVPIGIALNAAAIGQPVDYAGPPDAAFEPGFSVEEGVSYYLSTTAGKICLVTDLANEATSILLGIGKSGNEMNFDIVIGGMVGGSDLTAPTVVSFSPTDNSGDGTVSINANLVVTFSEAIAIGTGNILIKNLTDNSAITLPITAGSPQIGVSGSTLTINPTAALVAGKAYAIQIAATCIDDIAGNSYAGIVNDTTWNFLANVDPALPVVTAVGASTGVLAGEVDLDWTIGFDPSPGDALQYRQSADSGTTWISPAALAADPGDGAATLTSLTPGTEYTIQLRTVLGLAVSAWSATVTGTAQVAPTPTPTPTPTP